VLNCPGVTYLYFKLTFAFRRSDITGQRYWEAVSLSQELLTAELLFRPVTLAFVLDPDRIKLSHLPDIQINRNLVQ